MRKSLFFTYLVFTLAVMAALMWVGSPLTTEQAPYGIISYEFARTPETASRIISSWSSQARLSAAFSLGLDYLFMPLYAITIAEACRWASMMLARQGWPLSSLGSWLAGGLWLAASLDAIENFSLTALLFGSEQLFWPLLAFLSAFVKFLLIFIGMVYSFFGLVVRVVIRKPVDAV